MDVFMDKKIKSSELRPLVKYKVVTGTDCGTIQEDDIVKVDNDGSLLNIHAFGWLNPGEWENLEFLCVEIEQSPLDKFTTEELKSELARRNEKN